MEDRPLHVVVVAADDEARARISAWLELAGHSSTCAGDAADALVAITEELPDAAIVDLAVARDDGPLLSWCLHHRPEPGRLVVLASPGHFAPELAALLSADDWLVKPVARGELLRAVLPDDTREGPRGAPAEAKSLLALLHARSPVAFGHARRVRAQALALAREMALPAPAVEEVEAGALLHDIGALALPDEILDEAVRGAPADQALRSQVPRIGSRLLAAQPSLASVATAVAHAADWFDGTGGEAAPRGVEIPLASRIIAVADAADVLSAMTCGGSDAEIGADLARRAGTRFDPDVVAAWFRVVERRFKTAPSLPI